MSNVYRHQRGEIKESAVKALVTDPLFKMRTQRNKKGKGSYQRHAKHKGENPFKSEHVFKWVFC